VKETSALGCSELPWLPTSIGLDQRGTLVFRGSNDETYADDAKTSTWGIIGSEGLEDCLYTYLEQIAINMIWP